MSVKFNNELKVVPKFSKYNAVKEMSRSTLVILNKN